MKTHETAQKVEAIETKVPESLTAPAAIAAANKALKKLDGRHERAPQD